MVSALVEKSYGSVSRGFDYTFNVGLSHATVKEPVCLFLDLV